MTHKKYVQQNKSETKSQLGFAAEQRACNFLIQQGLKLIKKNFRTHFGEIDLRTYALTGIC